MADETPTLPAVRLERHASNGDDEVTCRLLFADGEAYVIDMTEDSYSALAAALDPATTSRLFDQRDAAIAERDQLRAELKALKLVPRCGNTVDSVLSDTPHLVCDLPYGHPGTWHGCDQWYAGSVFPTRAEWVERTEERSELEHALVEVERMRPVLEAALAVDHSWREENGTGVRVVDPLRDLAAAVDVYNQPPSPGGSVTE